MSQLKPERIVLHCGLHKTGSTYIQRNLQTNRETLIDHGILYIGPNTFKKRCSALWNHLQWGHWNKPTKPQLKEQTLTTLIELSGNAPKRIHTILISFEAIFGTLRSGMSESERRKVPNKENKQGLYRYAKSRTKRLMGALEDALNCKGIQWSILFATREQDAFIRSCHTQLIKEGRHDLSSTDLASFRQTADFSFTGKDILESSLSRLGNKRKLEIITMDYDAAIDPEDPSVYLWAVLEQALPAQAKTLKAKLGSSEDNDNLVRNTNPGLSDRGLELAVQARPLFNRSEWKLFRKFLEKNFAKTR